MAAIYDGSIWRKIERRSPSGAGTLRAGMRARVRGTVRLADTPPLTSHLGGVACVMFYTDVARYNERFDSWSVVWSGHELVPFEIVDVSGAIMLDLRFSRLDFIDPRTVRVPGDALRVDWRGPPEIPALVDSLVEKRASVRVREFVLKPEARVTALGLIEDRGVAGPDDGAFRNAAARQKLVLAGRPKDPVLITDLERLC